MIFAVIGAKETGKSHYIAVLIDKIMNEIGAAIEDLLSRTAKKELLQNIVKI